MDWSSLTALIDVFKRLGAERLIALALAGAIVLSIIGAAFYLSAKSGFETLYIGLSTQDVSRMGVVLSDAGISFDTSLDGTKIGVPIGRAAEARALLAEKGLPGSPNAGYELFDNLGALGLTSFMQQVTKARALEGELGRTIQYIKGVRSARVHLVLPERSSLGSKPRSASASVVISSDGLLDASAANAVRHLVAAAVPEMNPEMVSIVGTDGRVLAGGPNPLGEASSRLMELERQVALQIQDNVRRTLAPYFGPSNFEVSVLARLNIDKRQQTETQYDPDKRVERSIRVVKEAESSQAGGSTAVGVEQNIPNEAVDGDGGREQKRAQDRKEETTNYEISQKSSSTESNGFRIETMSVALVINRARVVEILGKPDPSEVEIKAHIAEVRKLVQAAAGLDPKRGDKIDISAVSFSVSDTAAGGGEGWSPAILAILGMLLKSLTVIVVAGLVVFAGLRPIVRVLLLGNQQPAIGTVSGPEVLAPPQSSISAIEAVAPDMPQMASPLLNDRANPFGDSHMQEFGSGLERRNSAGPIERLAQLLENDEEYAAAVLKHWIRAG